MLQKIQHYIRKSVWLYPALYAILSFWGALLVVFLDSGQWIRLDTVLPEFLLTSVDLSKTILGIVAGSLITMTTFTFSTTMVVLTMYSSQFSPRTIKNFLSDDETMKALGVFIGGFIYSIMALLFMQDSLDYQLVMAATLSIAYMLICLVQFIRYVHHVGSLIQTNNLIERLYDEALDNISRYKELLDRGRILPSIHCPDFQFVIRIKSRKNGYLQLVDSTAMMAVAEEMSGVVIFEKVVGQFVTDTTQIFSLYLGKEMETDDNHVSRLLECVTISNEKTEIQDLNFSIQKVVEVALRSISPGINDPNTANHCLRILGVLLGKLADMKKGYLLLESDQQKAAVYLESIDFEKALYFTFYQIVHYGKSDVSVMISLLKALRFAMEKASGENRQVILDFLDYVWKKIDPQLLIGYDLEMLQQEKTEILSLA